jgi:hypothetical protein
MTQSRFLAALAALALAAPLALPDARAADFDSAYTTHDYQTCPEIASPEPGVIDVRRCPGLAGKFVIWTGEPDASWIDFGTGEPAQVVDLGDFFEAGTTVEWRGPVVKGQIAPLAAIVRYRVGKSVGALNVIRLVVYRLTGVPCAIAVVDGAAPKANQAARAKAEASGAACL